MLDHTTNDKKPANCRLCQHKDLHTTMQLTIALVGKPTPDKRAFLCSSLANPSISIPSSVTDAAVQWNLTLPTIIPGRQGAGTEIAHMQRTLPARLIEMSIPQLNELGQDSASLPQALIAVLPASVMFRAGKRRPDGAAAAGSCSVLHAAAIARKLSSSTPAWQWAMALHAAKPGCTAPLHQHLATSLLSCTPRSGGSGHVASEADIIKRTAATINSGTERGRIRQQHH